MTRALTAPELVKLRTNGHHSRLYLAAHSPAIVFQAKVAGVFTSNDEIASFFFDTVTAGAYGDIVPGQTLYIGSAAGLYDYGMARIRKAATSDTLYIGESSEIDFVGDTPAYLTVVKEWLIWPKHARMVDDGATVYMDYEIAYSAQNTDKSPIANLGCDAVVYFYDSVISAGNKPSVAYDGSDSFCLDSSISAYNWSCSEASSVADHTTAAPTAYFSAAQTTGATIKCTVTAANGETTDSYRNVWAFDKSNPPISAFELVSCTGDYSTGGWSFTVRMWDSAARTEIRDRAKIVLFAQDFIAGVAGSVGTEAGRENILAVGWIAGETIHNDPVEGGWVEFTVEGPQYWMGRINGFPAGVRDTTATAAKWTEFDNLTVDKGLYHFLYWRTTLNQCCDWHKSGDTRRATAIEAPNSNLWAQITEMTERTILAKPVCDRFGRLYTQIPVEYIATASRAAAAPTVMTIQQADYERPLEFQRVTTREVAQVVLSGVYATPSTVKTFYSLSPGHVPANYGTIATYDKLLLSTQALSNALAALVSGSLNPEFPSIPVVFSSTNRAFDIAPIQRGYIAIPAADNERGIGYTGYILPRSISYEYVSGGYLRVSVEFIEETRPDIATDGDPPGETRFPGTEPFPPFTPIPWEPVDPVDPTRPSHILIREVTTGIWCWTQATDEWTNITSGLDAVEQAAIGAVFNQGMGAQLYGVGGAVYACSGTEFFGGNVTYGLSQLYDYSKLKTWMVSTNPSWANVAVHPYTGQVAAIARKNTDSTADHTLFAGAFRGFLTYNPMTATLWTAFNTLSFSSGGSLGAFGGFPATTLISTDLGATWTPIAHAGTGNVTRGGGYSKYLVMWGAGGLYTSDDNGATQTEKTLAVVGISGVNHQYAATKELGIIKCAGGANIYTSTDGAATWSSVVSPDSTIGSIINFGTDDNWLACANGSVGAGNTSFLYVTNDGGTTWVDITGDLYALIFASNGNTTPNISQVEIIIKPYIEI